MAMPENRYPELLECIVTIQRLILRAEDTGTLLADICQQLSSQHGYRLAWVGMRTERTTGPLVITAHSGDGDAYLQQLSAAAAQHDLSSMPLLAILEDGQPRLGHQHAAAELAIPLRHGGQILGILGILADRNDAFGSQTYLALIKMGSDIGHALDRLHELANGRYSDARLQFLVSSSPVVIYSCEVSETFPCTYISPNVREVMGFEPEQFTDNTGFWASNIHPDDKEQVFMHLPELFEHGHYTHEYRFRKNDDSYFWVRDELRLIYDDKGQPTQAVGSWADIQARKQTEQRNQNLQHSLLQAQKLESIGHMTGGVAHDFNNILAAILGFADLMSVLGDRLTPEKRSSYVEQIRTAGQRGRDLVRSMLTYARGIPVSPSATRIPTVLDDMLKMLRATIPTSVDIAIDMPDDLPAVSCDENHLRQIITNLCINAQAAMDDSGQLSISAHEASIVPHHCTSCHNTFIGHFVVLSIRDTGTGIPAENLSLIFDPFFSTKSFDKGTGMGLSIVHGLTHSNGGHIVVDSDEGHGTCIDIYLPTTAIDAVDDGPKRSAQTSLSPELTRGVRVLVVDDEPSLREMIDDMLSITGCKVDSVGSASEALSRLQGSKQRYQLLITDQTMPDMTGEELIRRLRADGQRLPILLYSGDQLKLDENKAKEIGASAFLSKPFSQQALLAQLQTLLADD